EETRLHTMRAILDPRNLFLSLPRIISLVTSPFDPSWLLKRLIIFSVDGKPDVRTLYANQVPRAPVPKILADFNAKDFVCFFCSFISSLANREQPMVSKNRICVIIFISSPEIFNDF